MTVLTLEGRRSLSRRRLVHDIILYVVFVGRSNCCQTCRYVGELSLNCPRFWQRHSEWAAWAMSMRRILKTTKMQGTQHFHVAKNGSLNISQMKLGRSELFLKLALKDTLKSWKGKHQAFWTTRASHIHSEALMKCLANDGGHPQQSFLKQSIHPPRLFASEPPLLWYFPTKW